MEKIRIMNEEALNLVTGGIKGLVIDPDPNGINPFAGGSPAGDNGEINASNRRDDVFVVKAMR